MQRHELSVEAYASCDSPYACAAAPVIAKKWVPVIVCHLLHGAKRYSELERAVPLISGKVLAENLLFMEEEGILERDVRNSQPVQVWYALTAKGDDLASVIRAMNQWGKKWLGETVPFSIHREGSYAEEHGRMKNPDILP